jgi:uncharacterized peroxidase-related enzyme
VRAPAAGASAELARTLPALTGLRTDVRGFTESVGAAVMHPAEDHGLSRIERVRIALRTAQVARHDALAGELAGELGDDAAAVGDPDRWAELGPRTAELLALAEQVALDPADAGPDGIAALRAAGLTPAQIVAASQVVAYTSYRVRLLIGVAALAADPVPAPLGTPATVAVRDDLPAAGAVFPTYTWRPWVDPAPVPPVEAGGDTRTPKKWSPFYLTLLHDPAVLGERTALYDAIMTGTGALGRADRELAALATSLVTGCEYCASVHGRRQVQLSSDRVTAVALAVDGPRAVADRRQRAIVDVAGRAAVTPPDLDRSDVARLRAAGLDDDAIRDLLAVVAMFAWANRLMMTLGEPER